MRRFTSAIVDIAITFIMISVGFYLYTPYAPEGDPGGMVAWLIGFILFLTIERAFNRNS